ncbi:ABC-F family ATP-binding cassette domain-containing protein [Candidatus Gracilibacteria bacterium]|nr:ABC-F family ATP-binding cassette domain-containing protein [Candidatus Gracilibacteria bacterium]
MLITRNLSYDSPNGQLFEDVNISLDGAAKKRIAIVGKNGCGKTSLLKIIRGELEPTGGSVSISHELIAQMPQQIEFPDESKLVGEYLESKLEEDWMTYKVEMVLQEVGLPQEIALKELKLLSGGQRVRIGLAELLLQEPTVLLLDEPTNHLDKESIEWLKKFVQDFTGTVAFVSHDRNFINAVVNQIWEITAAKKIEVYTCNYDQFLLERYQRYQKALEAFNFSQREVTELEEWLAENANHPKYKFTATVAQKKKALERMEKKVPPEPIADPRVRMRHLGKQDKGTIATINISEKSFGDKQVLGKVYLKIANGERILISGPNGSGKTTLLNIMSGKEKEFSGEIRLRDDTKIGYLQQFSTLNPNFTVLDEFGRSTSMAYTQGRAMLASYLFPADLLDSKVKDLSYGQQRRLELAILLANEPHILLLDEPTNHLDIFLREDLERFLLEQEIAMCIISHDQYFIDKIGITRELKLDIV